METGRERQWTDDYVYNYVQAQARSEYKTVRYDGKNRCIDVKNIREIDMLNNRHRGASLIVLVK
jgi:hypothetical protein